MSDECQYCLGYEDWVKRLERENTELKEKLDKAVTALRFYSEDPPSVYDESDAYHPLDFDNGKLAKQTLKKLGYFDKEEK